MAFTAFPPSPLHAAQIEVKCATRTPPTLQSFSVIGSLQDFICSIALSMRLFFFAGTSFSRTSLGRMNRSIKQSTLFSNLSRSASATSHSLNCSLYSSTLSRKPLTLSHSSAVAANLVLANAQSYLLSVSLTFALSSFHQGHVGASSNWQILPDSLSSTLPISAMAPPLSFMLYGTFKGNFDLSGISLLCFLACSCSSSYCVLSCSSVGPSSLSIL